MDGPLVSTTWLRDHIGDRDLTVVDCRFRLGEPGVAEALWLEGHIPGAAFLDVDRDLAGEPGEGGRHPLPEPAAFERAARRAGIGARTRVIAYDEAAEGGAARLWWLLRHLGHDQVAVLDGGLRAWRDEGGPLESGPVEHPPGDFTAKPREDDAVTRAELAGGRAGKAVPGRAADAFPGRATDAFPGRAAAADPRPERLLLDARAPERYRGEVEPIDPVAGHIPGAVNLPFAEVAPVGRFLPPHELRARFERLGAGEGREAVAYCGSGVTACVLVLAAEAAGAGPVKLYPGSWSEWVRSHPPDDADH